MFFTSPGNRIDLTQRQLNLRRRNLLMCHCFLVWMTIARLQSSIAATFLPCLPRTSARLLQTRASPGLRLKAVKLEVIQTDQNKTINVTFKKGRRVRRLNLFQVMFSQLVLQKQLGSFADVFISRHAGFTLTTRSV